MSYWYVIQTKPKKEKYVQTQLQRTVGDIFIPKLRGLITTKPLFPNYIFIRADLKSSETYRFVRYTRGVNKVLGDMEGPQPVPELVLTTLREATRDGSVIEQELLFKVGNEVSVKRGILRDLHGIIEHNIPEIGRVKVLFKWLSGDMRAVLKYTELERAL